MSDKAASIPIRFPRQERRSAWTAAACLALVLAGLAAYSDSFRGPFIFDDATFLDEPSAKTLWPIRPVLAAQRPVVQFTLALCYSIGGPGELGYHIFNVAVHLLAALTLFGIVRRTLTLPALNGRFDAKAAAAIAFCAALLWLLHPLQTQAVTYIVQRSESLIGLFYLLTLYCFIRTGSSTRPGGWHAAAVACCLLGMASKEVMVSAPLIVLLYDRIFFTGSFGETLRRRWGLYLGLAATWLVLGRSVGEAFGAHAVSAGFNLPQATPLEYARSELGVILHYLRLAFLPVGLCLDYDWAIAKGIRDIAPGAVVIGGLLAATAWALARRPMWGFAGAWFFLVLAPTSSIMPIRDLAFEHRMYLPLAALIVPATVAAYLLIERLARRAHEPEAALGRAGSAIAIALVVAIAGTFGALTFLRNRDYRSAITIWKDTTDKRKDNARAWTSLGDAYLSAGDCDEAVRCLTRAIKLQPGWSWHYSSRATAYLRLRRGDEAMRDCDTAIAMEPAFARAWFIRGSIYFQTRRFAEAIRNFNQAIELDPNSFDAVYNRGKAHASLNELREAVRDFDRAIELRPRSAVSYFNRGSAYALLRRPDRAVGDFTSAVELKPDFAEAYNGRGQALTDAGRPLQALADLDKAIELNPRFSEAYNNRGRIYGEANRVADAIRDFNKAVELKPSDAEPYFNRAVMYARLNQFDKALADVKEFQRLGGKPDPDPEFIRALNQAAVHAK
ncbi:MAG: tetratricopeptide repeat protein [Candidatus Brocadiia bacterium]|jgi:tetratricopeptide (TPR) repeat protein